MLLISVLLLFLCGVVLLFSKDVFIFVFSKKVWVHRVNSIEKKKDVSGKFSGIELDIVYDQAKSLFDVNHPPARSINLSLKDYLLADVNRQSGYWLDFKNLEPGNAESACNTLSAIVDSAGLDKKKVIVESHNYASLSVFANKGFQVSYYLPALNKLKGNTLTTALQKVSLAIKTYPAMFISSTYKDYPIMKQYFPQSTKLLWWSGSEKTFWNWRNKFHLYKMMNDKTVKVLLVPFHSKLGDR